MTIDRLKTRAKAYNMMIRKDGNGEYMLVDITTNCAVAPAPMSIEQVEQWLNDLDNQQE